MSVGLARKSAPKSNEKLVYQNYATLFSSWMPFSTRNFGTIYYCQHPLVALTGTMSAPAIQKSCHLICH